MSCEHDVHSCDSGFSLRIRFGFPCQRHLQQMVVCLSQQLAVPAELPGCIRDAKIDIRFTVSGEEYRFSLDGSVPVFRNAVAVESLFGLFVCPCFFPSGDEFHKPFPDGVQLIFFFTGDGFCRHDVQIEFPAAVQDKPVGFGILVYERCLPVGSVMADIFEGGSDDAVEIQASLPAVFRCGDYHPVHPCFWCSFHIPVESHPGSSPAGKSESVHETAAFFVSFMECDGQVSVNGFGRIYPEYECRYRSLFRIRVFRKIRYFARDDYLGAFFLPLPFQ